MSTIERTTVDAGRDTLRKMARARRFNHWMADVISPFVQGSIIEIGAGIGNMTELLCRGRAEYVATDTEGGQLDELRERLKQHAQVQILACDAADPKAFESLRGCFDSAVCLNVLEHIQEDEVALANIFSALRPSGKAILLVPQGAVAFGSLDEVLLHHRRYSASELETKLLRAGFRVERMMAFNRATFPGWILNSRILRRKSFSSAQLRLFDLSVPLWRRLDRYLPWPPNSLIAVAAKGS